ncbi:plasmid fertility inhibition factor family protein [Duganella sp. LjRoot269]|uniref:plasmid fertility inhibition factor family protein n=1 Tax=Duganella sp. LjRoot269 TaxID=3342305 RepID=UPI003ED043AB
MQLLQGIQKVHYSHGAVFKIPTAHRDQVFMCATRTNYRNDMRAVVIVDSERFLNLWRQPNSSHLDIAVGDPSTWPSDYKFSDAEDGFQRGELNPVPLATVDCRRTIETYPVFERWLLFFKRYVGTREQEELSLHFTNGITRTIWLLTAGAKSFPVECSIQSAPLLHQLAGTIGSQFLTIEQLIPERLAA